MQKLSSDIRKKIFTELVVVRKLGKISAEENLRLVLSSCPKLNTGSNKSSSSFFIF